MKKQERKKPLIGIYGLTGCAGDQLVLLNCEDELLQIAEKLDIRSFVMASSMERDKDPLDAALVEGSVCQPEDLRVLQELRDRAKVLVALGTCASWGGLPAMDQRTSREMLKKTVYGQGLGRTIPSIKAKPLKAYVPVDFELYGCPIEKHQLIQLIVSLQRGEFPEFPNIPVCAECKLRENPCIVIEKGEVCCGPLTHGGCRARCPTYGRPCDGCRGPMDEAYYKTTGELFRSKGITRAQIQAKLKLFSAPAGMAEKLLEEFDE